MTITLKNFECQNIMDVLGELSQQDIDDIKVSYRIGKIIKALSSHSEDYQESRKKIIQKHAKKDKDGNPLKATDKDGKEIADSVQLEDQDAFNDEIIEILNDEIEVQVPVSISIEELSDAGVKLKPHRVMVLEPILAGGDE